MIDINDYLLEIYSKKFELSENAKVKARELFSEYETSHNKNVNAIIRTTPFFALVAVSIAANSIDNKKIPDRELVRVLDTSDINRFHRFYNEISRGIESSIPETSKCVNYYAQKMGYDDGTKKNLYERAKCFDEKTQNPDSSAILAIAEFVLENDPMNAKDLSAKLGMKYDTLLRVLKINSIRLPAINSKNPTAQKSKEFIDPLFSQL